MGQLSTPLAEIPALFAEISARRVTGLSHILHYFFRNVVALRVAEEKLPRVTTGRFMIDFTRHN